jgi:SAM-dependent methyltransferase
MSRWDETETPRGAEYDRRFDELAARGHHVHGEADLVDAYAPSSVLDAGCGTGRVAIELSRRGRHVVGVDLDQMMLEAARLKAPHLTWVHGDLADPGFSLRRQFDVIVMAGNVLIFVSPGTEGVVLTNMARHLVAGGLLISGYSLRPDGFGVAVHDDLARRAGLTLVDRWSTWDRREFGPGSDYAVSVHQLESAVASS